jgi:hypothetical protein
VIEKQERLKGERSSFQPILIPLTTVINRAINRFITVQTSLSHGLIQPFGIRSLVQYKAVTSKRVAQAKFLGTVSHSIAACFWKQFSFAIMPLATVHPSKKTFWVSRNIVFGAHQKHSLLMIRD